jgi:hypothetical protein
MQNIVKKIIPYLLILIALVGLFGVGERATAESPNGICEVVGIKPSHQMTFEACGEKSKETSLARYKIIWTEAKEGATPITIKEASEEEKAAEVAAAQAKQEGATALEQSFPACKPWSFSVDGCLLRLYYFIFITIPSWLLILTGLFFNAIVAIALSSEMYSSTSSFILDAWTVVRDLSNIFFILILLYIAIKIILDMGGHEAKQMIAKVIIMALLINFSMFFTKVIIDTSNVLALVFYNKLTVKTEKSDGKEELYTPSTKFNERDIAGAFMSSLNPNKLLTGGFYNKITEGMSQKPESGVAKKILVGVTSVPVMLGVMFVYGIIILFAVYAFFIAGFSFMSRLIELWILIIFSPFAFMSFTIPKLTGMDYIGWDAWLKRLLTVSFMAPIFMFFMYFIFMLLKKDIPGSLARSGGADQSFIEVILFMIIPALLILILLLKATEFAKKGSGKFGEVLMTGAKIAGGFALGAATGGASMALQGTVGASALKTANRDDLKSLAAGEVDEKTRAKFGGMSIDKIKEHADFKKMQMEAQQKLYKANKTASKSFDIRDTGLGKFAESKTGMKFDRFGLVGMDTKSLKGGALEKQKKEKERAIETEKSYQMSGAAAMEQDELVAKQHKKDLEEARRDADNIGKKFDEETFEKEYKKGNIVGYGRDNRKVTVKTSAQINIERKNAYVISLKETHANPEIIAAVRKGEDPNKKWLDELKKLQTTGHGDNKAVAKGLAGLVGGHEHETPAPSAAPATPPPTGGNHPSH